MVCNLLDIKNDLCKLNNKIESCNELTLLELNENLKNFTKLDKKYEKRLKM